MNTRPVIRAAIAIYVAIFFIYLFGPLVVMSVTAFNMPSYPQVYPFEGFTLEWFRKLSNDAEVVYGLQRSLLIGILVVLLSVPIGLAGAIVMTQIPARARGFYYFVAVSPVLTPGIIIGISTVIFWRQVTAATGARFLYDGLFLTVMGQSCFISAYCMLILFARLQRFDRATEEAALDLGATRSQAFFHILLPYLRPAILSAAVLAFLASFENYNTTTFAILADKTLTTVLAGRVRQGTSPAISALAVVIIAVTVIGAVVFGILKGRETARRRRRLRAATAEEADDMLTLAARAPEAGGQRLPDAAAGVPAMRLGRT